MRRPGFSIFSRISVLAAALVLAGCSVDGYDSGNDAAQAGSLTREQIAADVLSAMDTSADPCEDFYRYACGGWLDSTELPADESRWARSFSEIGKRNREVLREVLDGISASPDAEMAKLGAFYGSCNDEETVERAGVAPLQPMLARIAEATDRETLMRVVGEMHASQIDVLFSGGVFGDLKNPEMNITHFFQGGLGLPDRDYYIDEGKSAELDGYRRHVAAMMQLMGEQDKPAARIARNVVELETALARVSRTRTQMRDVEKLHNKLNVSGLQRLTPQLPWGLYFEAIGYPETEELNVGTPEFFEGLEKLVQTTDVADLQDYLRWHLVHGLANQLPSAFVEENFNFFGKTLQGQQEMQPRWRRCVEATDAAMGELLGQAFVQRQFPGDSKQIALDMIQGIEGAFEAGLVDLAWMDDTTRERAVDKLNAVANKVGYPDRWRDYSGLFVEPGDYLGNTMRANQFEFRRVADKAGKPVDRSEWQMTPPTVNAYYNPLFNEMVFPAGILQQPFFHRDFPAAMNFGGIGMVMGHELTHGFDDSGRKFDARGKMEQWWDDTAVESFTGRTACVEQLYSGYEVQPGVNVNGKLTLGENIADLGGIKKSFQAYREHVSQHGEGEPSVDGVTDDQLFFVAFAQTWCMKSTPEIERMLITVDSHSPARFRVVGPAASLPQFAEVFGCADGTPMNPVERCEVW